MKRRAGMLLVVVLVSVAVLIPGVEIATAEDLSTVLQQVVRDNFAAYGAEDIERIMKTIHSQSPGYAETRRVSMQIFPDYDLTYELLKFGYIGQDADFAYARVQQKTSKVSGPQFQNNVIDVLFIFRQENGQWKFWSQALLETKFTE